jgi:hypothetical protein
MLSIQISVCLSIHPSIHPWNWLVWLWRLRSPAICHLQVGDSGKPVGVIKSLSKELVRWGGGQGWYNLVDSEGVRTGAVAARVSPEVWRPKNQKHPCLRSGQDGWPRSRREGKSTLSSFTSLFDRSSKNWMTPAMMVRSFSLRLWI